MTIAGLSVCQTVGLLAKKNRRDSEAFIYVGFADDDDDEHLHQHLGSLDLEDRVGSFAHSLRDITEEEKKNACKFGREPPWG